MCVRVAVCLLEISLRFPVGSGKLAQMVRFDAAPSNNTGFKLMFAACNNDIVDARAPAQTHARSSEPESVSHDRASDS